MVEELNRMEDQFFTAQDKLEAYPHIWTLWNMFIYSEEEKALVEVTPTGWRCPYISQQTV